MESKNVLKFIVEKYGEKKLLDDKLAGLVSDFIKNDDQLKKRLRLAINERVPQKLYELKSKDEESRKRVMKNIASGLSNEYGMSDAVACEIVDYFAEAMGYKPLAAAPERTIQRQETSPKTVQTRSETAESGERGNTPGNIINGGYTVGKGEWIYYSNRNGGEELYKIRTDGSGKTKLCGEKAYGINVVGDWVYYGSGPNINKMRTDGSARTKLCDVGGSNISVIGDWIFFTSFKYLNKISKMHTDGSGLTLLNNEWSDDINVVGNWIYYNSDGIIKIRTDGEGRTKLISDEGAYINVCEDWIYYANRSDDNALYKIRTDGKERVKISGDKFSNLNIADGWIYYKGGADGNLFKMRLDGSGNTKLSNDKSITFLNVAGGWVSYETNTVGGKRITSRFKVRTDGTDWQLA